MRVLYCLVIIFIMMVSSYIIYHCNCNNYEGYEHDKRLCKRIHDDLKKVHEKANHVTMKHGNQSYTVNKKHITMCLKDKDGKYYDDNMLNYVALHELAHVLCDEIGHTPKFYAIFDQLLEDAEKIGIYDKSIPIVDNYCPK